MSDMFSLPVVRPAGLGDIESRISSLEQRFGGVAPSASSTQASGVSGSGHVSAASFQNTLSKYGTGDVQSALSWGKTQLGTPYASANPFRFGDVPWDGAAHLSVNGNGKTYQFPAGTKVYDCSGFAVSLWRRAGIDLEKYGASNSRTMAERVPSVSLAQAQPGDLLIIDSDNNTEADHVQVYQGNGRVIQATGAGVNEANADWSHVTKVVRPSLLQPAATYSQSAVAGNVNSMWQQALQGAGSSVITSIGNI